jgi:hypothetical protein
MADAMIKAYNTTHEFVSLLADDPTLMGHAYNKVESFENYTNRSIIPRSGSCSMIRIGGCFPRVYLFEYCLELHFCNGLIPVTSVRRSGNGD